MYSDTSTAIRIISKASAEHHTDKDLFIEPASIYNIGISAFSSMLTFSYFSLMSHARSSPTFYAQLRCYAVWASYFDRSIYSFISWFFAS